MGQLYILFRMRFILRRKRKVLHILAEGRKWYVFIKLHVKIRALNKTTNESEYVITLLNFILECQVNSECDSQSENCIDGYCYRKSYINTTIAHLLNLKILL